MIQCKRFPHAMGDQYEEFFAYGSGAFFFDDQIHPDDGLSLYVVVPGSRSINQVRVKVDGGQGGKDERGWFHSWDGNRDAPTIRASILVPNIWHGWMTAGVLKGTS